MVETRSQRASANQAASTERRGSVTDKAKSVMERVKDAITGNDDAPNFISSLTGKQSDESRRMSDARRMSTASGLGPDGQPRRRSSVAEALMGPIRAPGDDRRTSVSEAGGRRRSSVAAGLMAPIRDPEHPDMKNTTVHEEDAITSASATSATNAATIPLSDTSVNKTIPSSALSTATLTQAGTTSTLSSLLAASQTGIVIFTYPRASTPGCTTQACLFRDNYDHLHAKGYDVYGLSNDSEKANLGFKTKQRLQYEMLCDPAAQLTAVLGMKKPGVEKGTLRGVVVLSKEGKVVLWFQGGPAKTMDAVNGVLGV